MSIEEKIRAAKELAALRQRQRTIVAAAPRPADVRDDLVEDKLVEADDHKTALYEAFKTMRSSVVGRDRSCGKQPDGWTYFITDGRSIKIGCTRKNDVKQRLCALQTGNASALRVVAQVPGFWREREFHVKFAEHRLEGEWFVAEPVLEYLREEGLL